MANKGDTDRLVRALESTGTAQIVKTTNKPNQISVIFRILAGFEPDWLKLVKKLLQAEKPEDVAWSMDISKPYFLKDDLVVYGWRLSVQSQNMPETLDVLVRLIRGEAQEAPKAGKEIMSMPFAGLEHIKDRNAPKLGSKKGAYYVGSGPVSGREP